METLKAKILHLISAGKTDKALEVLEEELRDQKHPLHHDAVVANAAYIDLNKSLKTNTISNEEGQIAKNKIRDSVMFILKELNDKKEDIPADPAPAKEDPADVPVKSKFKSGLVVTLVGGFVIVVLALFIVILNKINEPIDGTTSNSGTDSAIKGIPSLTDSNNNNSENKEDSLKTFIPVEDEPAEIDDSDDSDQIVYDLVTIELGVKIYNEYKDVYLHQNLIDPEDRDVFNIKRIGVQKDSKTLIKGLNRVKDDKIELHSLISKHIGLLISHKILALISKDSIARLEYTKKAFGIIEKLDGFIGDIDEIKDDDDYKESLELWISEEKHKDRILVNKFICMAVNYKEGGETLKEDIVELYEKLENSTDPLKWEGYHKYPIIQWLFDKKIVEHKH